MSQSSLSLEKRLGGLVSSCLSPSICSCKLPGSTKNVCFEHATGCQPFEGNRTQFVMTNHPFQNSHLDSHGPKIISGMVIVFSDNFLGVCFQVRYTMLIFAELSVPTWILLVLLHEKNVRLLWLTVSTAQPALILSIFKHPLNFYPTVKVL